MRIAALLTVALVIPIKAAQDRSVAPVAVERLYVEALSCDGNESFGNYDLTRQPDGTFVGHATLKWSCRFWCQDISCSTEQWVANSCTTESDVVLTHIGERRIEGYIIGPK